MESSTPVTPNNLSSNTNTSNSCDNTNNNTSTNSTTNTNNSTRSNKKTDTDLKSSIIEFMRERPFLWNSKHPNYKDHKRREQEFQTFSTQINCPVPEIKRVWHVLRTNFFRAHKLLLDRQPQSNGEITEKLWKYYRAMDYILEGTVIPDDFRDTTRQTRSSRASKHDLRCSKTQKEMNNNNRSCGGSSFTSSGSYNNASYSSSLNDSSSSAHQKSTTLSDIPMEADPDHLYARSLISTLKGFEPTTKEIIKLKFQEIIVSYMQLQQQEATANQKLAICPVDLPASSSAQAPHKPLQPPAPPNHAAHETKPFT